MTARLDLRLIDEPGLVEEFKRELLVLLKTQRYPVDFKRQLDGTVRFGTNRTYNYFSVFSHLGTTTRYDLSQHAIASLPRKDCSQSSEEGGPGTRETTNRHPPLNRARQKQRPVCHRTQLTFASIRVPSSSLNQPQYHWYGHRNRHPR